MLQLPPHLLRLTVKFHCSLYQQLLDQTDMVDCLKIHFIHFIAPLELEPNDPPNLPVVKKLNNPIDIFLINLNIILHHVMFFDYIHVNIHCIVNINNIIIKRKIIHIST